MLVGVDDGMLDDGRRAEVLTTRPLGSKRREPPLAFDPRTPAVNDGVAAGVGSGVGAVPNVMWIGAAADAPEAALIAAWSMVTV